MFKHAECSSEVNTKITSDGIMVIHCPKCNKLWADNLKVVQTVNAEIDTTDIRTDVFTGSRDGHLRSTDKITIASRMAFPEAFR
jgi:hypothetical protein